MSSDEQFKKMTETPVEKLIFTLSIPTIITMLVTNLYNLVDTAFVSQLGTSASGAIGIVFGFMSILQAVGFLFGQGAGSIMSRRLGQKDRKGASVMASTGIVGSFSIALIISVIGLLNLDSLVYLLGSTNTIAPYAKDYILYILLSAPFIVSSFTMNNLLRYEGKAKLGMVGLMAGAIINIAGDAILMFGLDMGVKGAGISTALSQLIGFLILLSMFLRKKTDCEISFANVSSNANDIMDILTTGFPSLLRQGLTSVTTVILNYEAAFYGDAAVAAFSIVGRITFLVVACGIGIGQGFQPVSAFNYGAKRYDRVKQGYRFTLLYSAVVLIFFGGILATWPEYFIALFRDDAAVLEVGTRALKLQSLAQFVMPFCMTSEMLCQSTGQKLEATILSGCRSGFIFIPALILLAKYRGIAGIQEAQPVSFVLSVIPTYFIIRNFFRNKLRNEEG